MPTLDTKAILEGRRPGRHSVGLIVGIAISVLCLLAVLILLFFAGLAAEGAEGAAGFLLSVIAAVVPVSIIIPLILLLDRLEPEPAPVLLFAFLWGAGIAVLVSLILNTMGMALYTVPVYGEDWGTYVGATVIAPVVEESAKGVVLLLLLWRRRYEVDSYTDGVIYAGMVAAGFAFTENISYFLSAWLEMGAGGLAFTFVLRGLVSPLGHPLFTAMIGLGMAYVAMNRGGARWFALFAGWVGAVLLHALWNGSTILGVLGFLFAYFVGFCVLITIIVIAVRDRRKQVAAIEHYLRPYLTTGLVTPADLHMLSTIRGRRQARRWAQHMAGPSGRRAMADYQLAATELALLHQRLDRGVGRPQWWHRRDSFLALMHVAREAFLGRMARPSAPAWASAPTDSGFLNRGDFQHVIDRARAERGLSGPSGDGGQPPPRPGGQRPPGVNGDPPPPEQGPSPGWWPPQR